MSNAGKTVVKEIAGHEVVCRELTVAQVRGLMASNDDTDLLGGALFEGVALADLPVFTSLTKDQIEAMRPSELAEAVAGCKEANPHFFALLDRLQAQLKTA